MKDDRYNSYSFLLDRTARRVKQFAKQQFLEFGFKVTVDQWIVLKHLDEHGKTQQSELAGLLFKDHPTLTRIIDLLCRKGLTLRSSHPKDRRSFLVALTPEGKKTVQAMRAKVASIRLQAWQGLSQADFDHFRKVLDAIYENLKQ